MWHMRAFSNIFHTSHPTGTISGAWPWKNGVSGDDYGNDQGWLNRLNRRRVNVQNTYIHITYRNWILLDHLFFFLFLKSGHLTTLCALIILWLFREEKKVGGPVLSVRVILAQVAYGFIDGMEASSGRCTMWWSENYLFSYLWENLSVINFLTGILFDVVVLFA